MKFEIEYSNYEHLSFDMWLTLIKSNTEFKKKRNLLLKDYFKIEHTIEKVAEVVRYYDVLCNRINEKNGLNIDTFEIYYLILYALDAQLDEVDIEILTEFYLETELLFMAYKPNIIHSNTGVFLKEVTEKDKTISVLSNTGFIKGFTLRKLITYFELDSFISFQIYSDETGFSKPNALMFKLMYDQINTYKKVQKQQILHIGDNIVADYDGAINFGLHAKIIKSEY